MPNSATVTFSPTGVPPPPPPDETAVIDPAEGIARKVLVTFMAADVTKVNTMATVANDATISKGFFFVAD
jgi:hypothetical protein